MVKTCPDCAQNRKARVEPVKGPAFPNDPGPGSLQTFSSIMANSFFLDYYSRDVELALISNKATAAETVSRMKKVFSRHGIPDIVVTDNGPQFAADEFASFAQSWGFEHVTSSPHYAQANGEVERAVQTIKNLMKKCDDEYLGLLMYRNTPLPNGFSPSQLSMGRRLKTRVPCHPDTLLPQTPDGNILKRREKEYREKMKNDYDRRHHVVTPENLSSGDKVWIPDQQKEGTVIEPHEAPRSLIIKTSDGGTIRRNRQMTRKLYTPSCQPTSPRAPTNPVRDQPAAPATIAQNQPVYHDQPASPQGPAASEMPDDPLPQQPAQLRRSTREKKAPHRLIEDC